MLHIPASRFAACLGLAGLIPFIVLACCLWLVAPAWQPAFAQGLLAWGAVILSFLGATHWGVGLGMPDRATGQDGWRYLYAVCPAMLAAVALLCPPGPGMFLLFWGLCAAFVVDRAVFRHLEWYVFLRAVLTVIASACLFAGYKAL